ncbi:hypothetical protein STRAU_5118 [Streptomyces aurantiacus JA 4570]|uniref:Uncharacterized protein n=1 Tax=Streptomyces aurantiacus JA 4570 TaxID=1286094 RepID=S3ZDU8_9ACTN|nr:hypothetical protein [Streptomyces aurantiacus]EPH41856.1 hypothetical protein STRAU_5118 [Streptomyces aurantiacus JA 4570]
MSGRASGQQGAAAAPGNAPAPTVKCLVWDLDDTLWDGVVLEGDAPVSKATRPSPSTRR